METTIDDSCSAQHSGLSSQLILWHRHLLDAGLPGQPNLMTQFFFGLFHHVLFFKNILFDDIYIYIVYIWCYMVLFYFRLMINEFITWWFTMFGLDARLWPRPQTLTFSTRAEPQIALARWTLHWPKLGYPHMSIGGGFKILSFQPYKRDEWLRWRYS